jgi:hypothetical protein
MREDQTPRADHPPGSFELPLPGVQEGRSWEDAVEHERYADIDAEENELHVTGRVCARCGRPLSASEEVRLTAGGGFQHEYCPP